MHIYQSRFLVRGEVWYDDEPDSRFVDWILYRQRSQPVPGTRCKPFYPLCASHMHQRLPSSSGNAVQRTPITTMPYLCKTATR
jgi:hypothetical protein